MDEVTERNLFFKLLIHTVKNGNRNLQIACADFIRNIFDIRYRWM